MLQICNDDDFCDAAGVAACRNDLECVKALIDALTCRTRGWRPVMDGLCNATHHDHAHIVQYLVDFASPEQCAEALIIAVTSGSIESMLLLVANIPDQQFPAGDVMIQLITSVHEGGERAEPFLKALLSVVCEEAVEFLADPWMCSREGPYAAKWLQTAVDMFCSEGDEVTSASASELGVRRRRRALATWASVSGRRGVADSNEKLGVLRSLSRPVFAEVLMHV